MEIQFKVRKSPEQLLEDNKFTVYKNCISSISEALFQNSEVAEVLTIVSNYDGAVFKLRLQKSYWPLVLKDCVSYFQSTEDVDLTIEAYQLLTSLSI